MPSELTDAVARARRLLVGFGVSALLALACLGLGAWVASGPTHDRAQHQAPYTSSFALSYRATPRPGTAYGTTAVKTGEPLFVAALETLALTMRYSLAASNLGAVHGTLVVRAYLADQGLDVPVGPVVRVPVKHSGPSTATVTLPMARYRAAIASLEHLSGATDFPLDVVATADLRGILAGRPFATTPSARFGFQATPWEVVLAAPTQSTPGTPVARPTLSTTTHKVSDSLRWSTTVDRRVGLGPLQVPRRSAGLALAAAGVLVAGLAFATRRRLSRLLASDQRLPALLRLGTRASSVVDLGAESLAGRHVVRLSGVGDLLKVAKALESPVLHASDPASLRLQVRDGRDVYVVEIATNDHASETPSFSAPDEQPLVDAPTAQRSTPHPWQAGTPPVGNGRRA